MNKKILTIILSCIFLSACNDSESGAKKISMSAPIVNVDALKVKLQDYTVSDELNGRTLATMTADVRPQISGVIESRNFKEGDFINKGQILYKIEDDTYKANYNKAIADLKLQEASLKSSKLKFERYRALSQSNNVSKQDVEDAESAYKQILASIAASKAQVQSAQIDLNRTNIKAPISGYIGISNFTPGALVTANQTDSLATIRSLDNIYVDLTQSSYDAINFRESALKDNNTKEIDNVTLTLENGKVYPQKGKILLSEYNVDQSTGTVTLRAIFPNKDQLLLPGMFVRANVDQKTLKNVALIPTQALFRNKDGSAYVFISDNNKVKIQTVETNGTTSDDKFYIITDGIKNGDVIITSNSNKIMPDQTIKINDLK